MSSQIGDRNGSVNPSSRRRARTYYLEVVGSSSNTILFGAFFSRGTGLARSVRLSRYGLDTLSMPLLNYKVTKDNSIALALMESVGFLGWGYSKNNKIHLAPE
jgi:hypothetical protein